MVEVRGAWREPIGEASLAVGVSWPVGARLFRHAGGMPPVSLLRDRFRAAVPLVAWTMVATIELLAYIEALWKDGGLQLRSEVFDAQVALKSTVELDLTETGSGTGSSRLRSTRASGTV
ncbi:hypothetical protein [Streptomyces goshikiensis]|uniref:hypothetical protein n=1 Tax=Streptomyces goshikiensis TaxID=1942 RepID=UPI0036946BA6